jgi:hypothetical protein
MGSIELILIWRFTDLPSEVTYGRPATLEQRLIETLRAYRDGVWRNWIPRTIYRQQTWYANRGLQFGDSG